MVTIEQLNKQLEHAKEMEKKNLRLWKLRNVSRWQKEILRIERSIAYLEEKKRK